MEVSVCNLSVVEFRVYGARADECILGVAPPTNSL